MKPKLHFTAPYHWINDPNGLIYYKGNYHIFYQHFPYDNKWGTMHWGHAITKDFVNFEHLPIALYPSKDFDRNGCFSGSAIEIDGQLYLYYTAIKYAKENPSNVHNQYSDDDLRASQALVVSSDGIHFDNVKNKKQIIPMIQEAYLGDYSHTRDPKIWKNCATLSSSESSETAFIFVNATLAKREADERSPGSPNAPMPRLYIFRSSLSVK